MAGYSGRGRSRDRKIRRSLAVAVPVERSLPGAVLFTATYQNAHRMVYDYVVITVDGVVTSGP